MRRNSGLLIFLLAALLLTASAFSFDFTRHSFAAQNAATLVQDSRPYTQDVDKVLRRYDKLTLDPAAAAAQVEQTGRIFLPTSTGGFDITLTAHDMRAARYRAQETLEGGVIHELERGPVRTYKGSIAGMPNAQARLTIDKGTFEGLIITPGQIYFVEPAKHYSTAANNQDFIVYQQSDLLQRSFGECGVTLAEKVGNEAARVQGQAGVSLNTNAVAEEFFSPPRTIDLATEADFEYFTFFGSNSTNANNEIIAIMNQVEGIYDTQFGLQFSIVFQNVWTFSGDPYTTTNSDAALNEFTGYWNANHGTLVRDLAHMWTGKSFDGNTIGIAWRPGVDCPMAQNGYGMSERLPSTPGKFILTAHEIGHGFNATHADAQPGCANTIMGTSLGPTTSQSFCPFSVNEIETHANAKVACLAQALTPGCTYTLSATGQSVGSSGGSGSVNVTTVGTNCVWSANSAVTWIIVTSGNNGVNSGTVQFAVAPNSNGFARSGLVRIAERDFIVSQAGAPSCTVAPISLGQTINGSLSGGDCQSSQRTNTFADQYSFSGAAGEQVSIAMSRTGVSTLDTYLYLIGPNGSVVTENDDIVLASNTDSRIPITGFFSLPVTGTYIIEATSFDPNFTGNYSLTLTSGSPNTVQLSQATFTANEGASRVDVSVSRSGVVSGSATVKYATSDTAGLTNCNVVNGIGSSRCDYAVSVGTLSFAAGETSKSFSIPLVDDSYAEGTESFTITLSSPSSSSLGAQVSSTISISDNETSTGPNPIFVTAFFVRQHYIDFLGREPDPVGFQGWQNVINNCPAGDISCDRVHVSGAFYQSPEFQQRGYFIYRFYPVAFGRKPDYAEFIPDLARVSGFLTDAQLEAAKVAFIADFMARPSFITEYNGLSDTQYVDKLLMRAGVTSPNRDFWIAALGNGTRTRATVLRDIAESPEVFQKYFNQAFVVMQYFGYLRRDPDAFYLTWIQILDSTGDSRGMITGFVNSDEYRIRFGP
ncbi:MAG TPA: M12 family metallo-peptidase [Pyrinomonadaceae bacterium]|nr:M12 family metallo-peptidase [Pyrinomonadaceae bacterium]